MRAVVGYQLLTDVFHLFMRAVVGHQVLTDVFHLFMRAVVGQQVLTDVFHLFMRAVVVRPTFPMMTITSSMMMMSCLVDPVGAEVANQSNSGLQHSSTLGAWVCRAG